MSVNRTQIQRQHERCHRFESVSRLGDPGDEQLLICTSVPFDLSEPQN